VSSNHLEVTVEKKEKNTVCTYIHTLLTELTNNKQHKTRINLVIPETLDEAIEILAPLFHTTKSNLATEGLLKHVEYLASQVPADLTLTVIQPMTGENQPDPMLDLEVDLIRDKLRPHVERLEKIKLTPEWRDLSRTRFSRDQIEKLLDKAIRLARRSKDPELEQLVFKARELLRV